MCSTLLACGSFTDSRYRISPLLPDQKVSPWSPICRHPPNFSSFPASAKMLTMHLDMQMVSLTLRVMSRPDMNQLPKIYQNLGLE